MIAGLVPQTTDITREVAVPPEAQEPEHEEEYPARIRQPNPRRKRRLRKMRLRAHRPTAGGEEASSCPTTNARSSFLRITTSGHRSMSVPRPNVRFWILSAKSAGGALRPPPLWTISSGTISPCSGTTSTGCTRPGIRKLSSDSNLIHHVPFTIRFRNAAVLHAVHAPRSLPAVSVPADSQAPASEIRPGGHSGTAASGIRSGLPDRLPALRYRP